MLPKRIADTSKISPQIPIIHRANTILQLALVIGLIALGAVAASIPQAQSQSSARPTMANEADFRRAMQDLSNWGRWGNDDELGAANLVTPAKRLLKARILLKADVSEVGEGWSDSKIIDALETSASMVYRVRRQLVEAGFEAALNRKQPSRPAVLPIFDGEKEAKLIALACSKPPKGYARWSLRLLENKVVELAIVDRASDSTIGRVLKKTLSSPTAGSSG